MSIVVAGRHDDLRGDFVGRLQSFVDLTVAGCREMGVNAEVLIVEWAPEEWMAAGPTFLNPEPRNI